MPANQQLDPEIQPLRLLSGPAQITSEEKRKENSIHSNQHQGICEDESKKTLNGNEELQKFQEEMKKKCQIFKVFLNQENENNGMTNIEFSFLQKKEQFILFFNSLDFKEQLLSIDKLQGFKTQIYHIEKEGLNYMYVIIFRGDEKIEESLLFHEKKKDYCLKRVEKWIVQKFLELIQSDKFYISASISGQDVLINQRKAEEEEIHRCNEEKKEINVLKNYIIKKESEIQELNCIIKSLEESLTRMRREFEKKDQEMKETQENLQTLENLKQKLAEVEQDKRILEEKLNFEKNSLSKLQYEDAKRKKESKDLQLYTQDSSGELKKISKNRRRKLKQKFKRYSKKHPSFLWLDSKNQPVYYVDEVVRYKEVDGKDYYEIKWSGARNNTWEPVENLEYISIDLLEKVKKEKMLKFDVQLKRSIDKIGKKKLKKK